MKQFKFIATTPQGEFEVTKLHFLSKPTNGCFVRLKGYPHKESDSMIIIKFEHLKLIEKG